MTGRRFILRFIYLTTMRWICHSLLSVSATWIVRQIVFHGFKGLGIHIRHWASRILRSCEIIYSSVTLSKILLVFELEKILSWSHFKNKKSRTYGTSDLSALLKSASMYGIGLNVQLSVHLRLIPYIEAESLQNQPQCMESASMYSSSYIWGWSCTLRPNLCKIGLNVRNRPQCTALCTFEVDPVHWGRISAKSASMYGIGLNVQLFIHLRLILYIEAESLQNRPQCTVLYCTLRQNQRTIHWGQFSTLRPIPYIWGRSVHLRPIPYIEADFASMYNCAEIRPQCMESASMYGISLICTDTVLWLAQTHHMRK